MPKSRFYFRPSTVPPDDPMRDDTYWTSGGTTNQALVMDGTTFTASERSSAMYVTSTTFPVGSVYQVQRFVAPVPRVGLMAGTFRMAQVALQQVGGTAKGARLRVRVRVLDANNVPRGTLLAGTYGPRFAIVGSFSSPAGSVVAVNTAMTPVEGVLPTDRLLVELGMEVQAGSSSNNFKLAWFSPAGAADLPLIEGLVYNTNPGRSWLEFDWAEPPGPPTDLTAVGGSGSITLSWRAPVSEYAAESYDVQVVGGALEDAGNVTSYTVGSLTPDTAYVVQVRARNAWGVSAWVTVEATTLSGADYRAVVRVGSHTWDVTAGDPPTLGPILPVSFGWAVPEDSLGFPAQPDPDVCNLELVTADGTTLSGVDIGTTMRVSIYTTMGDGARPLATFRGRVADMEAAPHPHGLAWRLLGIGYDTDLGTQVGQGYWPQESGDARAARIVADSGAPGWSAPAIGSTFEAREPAPVSARDALADVSNQAVSAEGNPWGPSRRVLVHPVTDANGDLTTFQGSAVVRRTDALDFLTAGLVNRATTWRRTKLLDATWVRIDHPGGVTNYGDTRGPAYPPLSVSVTDPRELADLILDTTPGFRWLTGQPLRLELWADDGPALGIVSQWFHRDPDSPAFPWSGRAVIVENIAKTPDGSTRYAGMLSAATLRLEPTPVGGRLVVEFRLRPEIPAHSTVTMRWMDEPITATWDDEMRDDPFGTWHDYYTRPRP